MEDHRRRLALLYYAELVSALSYASKLRSVISPAVLDHTDGLCFLYLFTALLLCSCLSLIPLSTILPPHHEKPGIIKFLSERGLVPSKDIAYEMS
jgi:hypothetical protein